MKPKYLSVMYYILSAIVLWSNDFKIQITAILFSAKCNETFFRHCVLSYLSYDNHAKLFWEYISLSNFIKQIFVN